MCGTPRHPEDVAAYDPIRHHLLKRVNPGVRCDRSRLSWTRSAMNILMCLR
jgi:hypothetical protein